MDIREIFAKNARQLRDIKGLKNNHIVELAKVNAGLKLHASTVANVLENKTAFKADTVTAIAAALDVQPYQLFNPLGFDDDGNSVGNENNSFPTESIKFALNSVLNIAETLNIDDRKWLVDTVTKVAITDFVSSREDAERELLKLVAFSGLKERA